MSASDTKSRHYWSTVKRPLLLAIPFVAVVLAASSVPDAQAATYVVPRNCASAYACGGEITYRDYFGNYQITAREYCAQVGSIYAQWLAQTTDYQFFPGNPTPQRIRSGPLHQGSNGGSCFASPAVGDRIDTFDQNVQRTFAVHIFFQHFRPSGMRADRQYNCDVPPGLCQYFN